MFLLLKELSPPDGLPARTHPLGRGVFNETPSLMVLFYHNWLVEYLNSRQHCTKYNSVISTMLQINASFVQGSRIGPIAYVLNTSDLHPVSPENSFNKYADDTYMVVPASNSHTSDLEMQHVSEWAQFNNLRLNTTKSVELIIHRPGVKLDKLSVPPPTLGLTRKTTTKILGVTITDTLSFSPHITDVIARCSQTSYALRILRAHGLNGPALWNVTRSTLISKLLYASPVWFGYLDKESRDQCQSLLNRLKRWGFLGKDFDNFITLCENADDVLFSALLMNENHVLHQLLPPVKCTQYNLRNRPHNYTLPKVNNNYIKNNFMFRMLYKNIY